MPEWYAVVAVLLLTTLLGFLWKPLFLVGAIAALALGVPVAQAFAAARKAHFPSEARGNPSRSRLIALTTALFLIQPVARLWGRIGHGLTPWRKRNNVPLSLRVTGRRTLWSERWHAAEEWLSALERLLTPYVNVRRGGDFDDWDVQLRGGLIGSVLVTMAVEEHGAGRQLLRFRVKPVLSATALLLIVALALAAIYTGTHVAALLGVAFGLASFIFAAWTLRDWAVAAGAAEAGMARLTGESK
jgi:hypothetical protein